MLYPNMQDTLLRQAFIYVRLKKIQKFYGINIFTISQFQDKKLNPNRLIMGKCYVCVETNSTLKIDSTKYLYFNTVTKFNYA